MTEALLRIEMSEYPARAGYMKALERQGYQVVRLPSGSYSARSAALSYTPPRYPCPRCQKQRNFSHYITLREIEHPWCQTCRHEDYAGSERARAERDDCWKRGELPVRSNIRCANPNCPSGGEIPPEKWAQHPKYCSLACQRAAQAQTCRNCDQTLPPGTESVLCADCRAIRDTKRTEKVPCANPECLNQVRPPRRYCSMGCLQRHRMATGFFHQISEKGTEMIHNQKLVTGHGPGYEQRASAVSAANQKAGSKAKVEREARAYGYQVSLHPDGLGGYQAECPDLPGVAASAKTAKQAVLGIRRQMREKGLV